jgi:hypothetical protein
MKDERMNDCTVRLTVKNNKYQKEWHTCHQTFKLKPGYSLFTCGGMNRNDKKKYENLG